MPIFRMQRGLLDGFRKGEPEAIEVVYWEYVRKVERLLWEGFKIRNRGLRIVGVSSHSNDLADLVQEVFVRAFSSKGRLGYDGRRDYGPYLFAIARNTLVDWARAKGREIPLPWADIEAAVQEMAAVVEPAPWADPATMRIVEEYLQALPSDLREVHRLRYEEGLSQMQAADRLGIGRQTLRTLEGRLRDGLAAVLDAAGFGDFHQPKSDRARIEDREWIP
jgi:RNA polymerase sigma factor (sigma-70 family)